MRFECTNSASLYKDCNVISLIYYRTVCIEKTETLLYPLGDAARADVPILIRVSMRRHGDVQQRLLPHITAPVDLALPLPTHATTSRDPRSHHC